MQHMKHVTAASPVKSFVSFCTAGKINFFIFHRERGGRRAKENARWRRPRHGILNRCKRGGGDGGNQLLMAVIKTALAICFVSTTVQRGTPSETLIKCVCKKLYCRPLLCHWRQSFFNLL